MTRTSRGLGRLIPVLALLGFAAMLHAQTNAQDIVVGQTLSLTGPFATRASDIQRGRQACVDLVNARGGIRGQRLRLVTRDDQGDPSKAIALAQDLANRDGAVALLGSVGPAVNGAILDWANEAGMAVIGPHGTDIEAPNRKATETAFYLTASQSAEAEQLTAHVLALGLSRVVIVYALDPAGETALNALEKGLSQANISAVALVTVKSDGSDAALAAQTIAISNAQGVLLATSGKATTALLKAMAGSSAVPLLHVYGLSSSASQAELAELGRRVRGYSMSQVVPSPRDTRYAVISTFQEAMRQSSGQRNHLEVEGCLAPLLLAEVLGRHTGSPTRSGVLQAMRTAGQVNLGGFEIGLGNRGRFGSLFTDIVYVSADGRIVR